MALPVTTRARMRELFNIPKTGQTEVKTEGGSGSVLVSDGITEQDLGVITVARLQEYLESEEVDFAHLWALAVRKADMTLSEVGKQTDLGTGDNGAKQEIKHDKTNEKDSQK